MVDGALDRYRGGAGVNPGGAKRVLLTIAVFAVVACLALHGAIGEALCPGELIAPIDPDLESLAIFIGTFVGVLLAVWMATMQSAGRFVRAGSGRGFDRVVTPAFILVLPILAATATARWGVQQFAFAGLAPRAVPAEFTVVGTERSGRSSSHWLRLRHGADGRVFRLRVGAAVYYAAHAGDAVTLPVETGRQAIQRMMPDRPLAVADLRHAG